MDRAGRGRFRQLFVNGRRAQRARTPNYGFFRIDGPSSQNQPFVLKFRGDDIKSTGGEVVALLAWSELRMPVVSLNPVAHTAVLAGNPRPSNRETDARSWDRKHARWARFGRANGIWTSQSTSCPTGPWPEKISPRPGRRAGAPPINPPARRQKRHIPRAGLLPRRVDHGRRRVRRCPGSHGSRIGIRGGRRGKLTIDRCNFSPVGRIRHLVWQRLKRNNVTATEIFDMGAGGIKIGEMTRPTAENDQTFENILSDDNLHDLGPGLPFSRRHLGGTSSRNTIAHNHIHDLYYTAISVDGPGDMPRIRAPATSSSSITCTISAKACSSDMEQSILSGVQPRTVIRNNLIHDVESFTYGGWGIYPDEGSSEMVIENNVVNWTKSAGFHQHHGRKTSSAINIFGLRARISINADPRRGPPVVYSRGEYHLLTIPAGCWRQWLGRITVGSQDVLGRARRTGKSRLNLGAASAAKTRASSAPGVTIFHSRPDSPAWKLGREKIDLSTVGPRETKCVVEIFCPRWPRAPRLRKPPPRRRKGRLKQCVTRGVFARDMSFEDTCREAARLGCKGYDLIGPPTGPRSRSTA